MNYVQIPEEAVEARYEKKQGMRRLQFAKTIQRGAIIGGLTIGATMLYKPESPTAYDQYWQTRIELVDDSLKREILLQEPSSSSIIEQLKEVESNLSAKETTLGALKKDTAFIRFEKQQERRQYSALAGLSIAVGMMTGGYIGLLVNRRRKQDEDYYGSLLEKIVE